MSARSETTEANEVIDGGEESVVDDLAGVETPEPTEAAPAKADEPKANETVDESVDREIAKLEKAATEGEDDEPASDGKKVVQKAGEKPTKDIQQDLDADLLPPEGLRKHEREEFMRWKFGARRSFNRMYKNAQRETNSKFQELAAERRAVGSLLELEAKVKPRLQGLKRQSAVYFQELADADMELAKAHSQDPKERESAARKYIAIGQDLGLLDDGGNPVWKAGVSNGQNNLHTQALQNELKQVRSELAQVKGFQQEAQNRELQPIIEEIDAVADEADANGNLIFPELHDPGFQQEVRPVVHAIMRRRPDMSWGDATRLAASQLTGRPVQSARSVQTKPTPSNNDNSVRRRAAVSVRGSSAPSVSGPIDYSDMPKDIDGQIAWIEQRAARGLQIP